MAILAAVAAQLRSSAKSGEFEEAVASRTGFVSNRLLAWLAGIDALRRFQVAA